jgi:hypothetical protein
MSLNTIAGAGLEGAQPSSSLQSNWQNVLSAASKTLGLGVGSVTAQLKAGASLSSIAQSHGISQGALIDAIAGALSPSTQAASTAAERQQIATSIAGRAGAVHGRHAHQQSGGPADSLPDGLEADAAVSVSISSADVLVVLTAGASPPSNGSTVDQLA